MKKDSTNQNPKKRKSIQEKGEKSLESMNKKVLKSEQDFSESTENQLEDSRGKLQLIIDSMPAVIGYINTDFQFQFANKFLKNFLNADPSNIIGQHIKNVVGERAFEKVKHKYEAAFAGERQEFEALIPLPDGQSRPIHATYIPHKVSGNVVGTFILIQDISKRKQNENELKEAKNDLEKANLKLSEALEIGQNQFNLFADNLPGKVFIKNEKFEYIFLNQNSLNEYNLNKKKTKGLTTHDLFSANIANKLHELDKEVQRKKQIIEKELKTSENNKNEKWERIIKFPIEMPDGKVFVGGFTLDITQSKQRNQEIKNSELRYRSLFESARDGIFIVDNGRIIDANPSALKKFGYEDKSELLNKTIFDVSPEFQPDGSLSKKLGMSFMKKVLSGEMQRIDWQHIRKDGTKFYTEVSANRLFYQGNHFILASIRDISKKVATQKELKDSEQRFSQAFDNSPIPISILNFKTGKRLAVNNAFCNNFGYSKEELLNEENIHKVNIAVDQKAFKSTVKKIQKEGIIFEHPFSMYTKSGEIRLALINGTQAYANNKDIYITSYLDITERTKAELEIVKAKEKAEVGESYLNNILNNIGDPVFVKDNKSRLILVNDAFCTLFNLTKDKIIGKTLAEDVSLDEREEFLRIDNQVIKTGQESIVEESLTIRGGQTKKISTRKTRYIGDNDEKFIIGVIRDITERLNSEEKIKESKTKFEILSNVTFEGILIHDNGVSIDVNNSFPEMFGYTKEEFLNKDLYKLIIKREDRNVIIQNVKNEYESPYEVVGVKKDGTEFPIEIEGKTYISNENKKYRVAAIRDITERKKAEEKIKQALSQLNLAVDTAKLGVWTHSIKTGKLEWNRELFEIFGIDPSEFDYSADAFKKRVHPDDLEYVLEKHDKAGQNKSGASLDFRIIRPNNEVRYIYATVTPVFDEEENLTKTIGINLDVTERKKAEEKLAQTNLELSDAVTSLNELKKQLEDQNVYLKKELDLVFNFEEMVYGSAEFSEVLTELERVAPTDATVLLLGESGTGKELLARALHNLSLRNKKPFIKVNCSAIPSELIESELFGHKKGSFTGAVSDKVGKFELADGGTLFLDEIGDLPLSMQPKLLRFLQEGEMEVVGGIETRLLDVRIVTATNKNLKAEVEKTQFREDLYFRLNVFPIEIPALKDRKEDIPLLVEHFADKFGKKYRKKIKYISDSAMQDMKVYNWPGNIRELENLVERSVILSDSETLSLPGFGSEKSKTSSPISGSKLTLDDVQRSHILSVLKKTNWKVGGQDGAALVLDIKPSTLRDKMKKLGIKRPD